MILGIDVGGSTTKIIGFSSGNRLVGTVQVKATDQVTCAYGAIGNFVRQYHVSLNDIETIVLTGVGASFFTEDIYHIPTIQIDEFRAIGYGGLYLADMAEAFVASMGTGTALVRATGSEITHIGGSGIGGGTLIGLSSLVLNKSDMDVILSLAEHGRIEHIDLSVRDILNSDIPSLPANLTASNFGKVKSTATEADYALGIINMILETIGMLAAFATRNDSIKDVILTGNLTLLPQAQGKLSAIADMYGIKFIIPPNAVYATAIGAAVCVANCGTSI